MEVVHFEGYEKINIGGVDKTKFRLSALDH